VGFKATATPKIAIATRYWRAPLKNGGRQRGERRPIRPFLKRDLSLSLKLVPFSLWEIAFAKRMRTFAQQPTKDDMNVISQEHCLFHYIDLAPSKIKRERSGGGLLGVAISLHKALNLSRLLARKPQFRRIS